MSHPVSNTTRYYHNQYTKAYQKFNDGDAEAAEDACCELISDYQCPRLLQIQAWQLRSVCTKDYWFARSHLKNGLDLIASLNDDEEPLVKQSKEHTTRMLEDIGRRWVAHWAKKGLEAPKEQRIEDTYVKSESEEERAMEEPIPEGDEWDTRIEECRMKRERAESGEKGEGTK